VDIQIEFAADLSEVSKAINNLVSVIAPANVHNLAGKRAFRQVKGKYAARFRAQVNEQSDWQLFKKDIPLPMGSDPGFFTGTTYNSIRWSADDDLCRVFLEGMWPQGSFAWPEESESPKKPGDTSGNLGAESPDRLSAADLESIHSETGQVHWGGKKGGKTNAVFVNVPSSEGRGFYGYIKAEPLETKKYGKDGRIKFMYLDQEDVNLIRGDMEGMLRAAIQGKKRVVLTGGEGGGEQVEALDLPESERKALETDQLRGEVSIKIDNLLQSMRAKGASEAIIERHRKELEAFIKAGGSL